MLEDSNNNKDMLAKKLTKNVIINKNFLISLLDYSIYNQKLAYNKKWYEIAELQLVLKEKSNDFWLVNTYI